MSFPSDTPNDMNDLLYFTNRTLADGTRIIAWTEKQQCACGGRIGKPVNPKTGRPQVRSPIYVCSTCGEEHEKAAHDATLTLEIRYSDPTGTTWNAATAPYTRKTWKGVPAYVFTNAFTGATVGITKKLKEPKGKKTPIED